MKEKFFMLGGSVLGGVIGAMTLLGLQHFWIASPVAGVDINAIVDKALLDIVKSKNENVEQESARFFQQIEKEMITVAKERKQVLFLKEAVLSGAPDLTEVVYQRAKSAHKNKE